MVVGVVGVVVVLMVVVVGIAKSVLDDPLEDSDSDNGTGTGGARLGKVFGRGGTCDGTRKGLNV